MFFPNALGYLDPGVARDFDINSAKSTPTRLDRPKIRGLVGTNDPKPRMVSRIRTSDWKSSNRMVFPELRTL
jgi:hypothetical protein